MRLAVFRAMLLTLLRDPAAFIMSFLLPAGVFLIFAVIFAGASGGSLQLRVALIDLEASDASKRFVAGIEAKQDLSFVQLDEKTPDAVTEAVKTGQADIGVIVRGGARTLQGGKADGDPPILLMTDPTRDIAVAVVEGIVQETYFENLSHIVVSGVARDVTTKLIELDPIQAAKLNVALTAMAEAKDTDTDETKERDIRLPFEQLIERESAIGDPSVPSSISYYAGAVTSLFLLYSALLGALSLLQDRESGLLGRLATGPAKTRPILEGKFFFLVALAMVQATIIFCVAWLGFGLDLPSHFGPWFGVTLATSIAAAGLMLGFVSLCGTVQQAQSLGTMVVLVVSAIGGSMIPRFLMPSYVQTLGWATPNSWTLEGYGAIFWRNESWMSIALPVAILVVAGLIGLLTAHLAAARRIL